MSADDLAQQAAERVRQVIGEAERRADQIVREAEAEAARIRQEAERSARPSAETPDPQPPSPVPEPPVPHPDPTPPGDPVPEPPKPEPVIPPPATTAPSSEPVPGLAAENGLPPGEAAARLLAMKLALEGRGREEIAGELESRFGAADRGALLDDVLSRAGG